MRAAEHDVVLAEGESFVGELVSISPSELTFTIQNEVAEAATRPPRTVTLDALVRWGHPAPPRQQTIVALADGGRLVAAVDYAGGAAVRLADDDVIVLSGIFNEVTLPRASVRGIVFAQQRHRDERAALEERVRSFDGRADAVFLANGDRLTGRLSDLVVGSLTMAIDAGDVKLPLSRVDAVALGISPPPSPLRSQPKLIVGLQDGSLIYCESAHAAVNSLAFKRSDAVELNGGSVEDVVYLQSTGGRFVYLSDLQPAAYRHVPYLQIEWPWRADRNVLGDPIMVRGNRYLKGIAMHSASRLTYRLDGEYARFDAEIALDDSAEGRGSVTFVVYAMRDGQWQEAFQSPIIRGGDVPLSISADVRGAEALTLTVDYADRGDEMDRAVWLDARVVKE